jgi:hypothetical protein
MTILGAHRHISLQQISECLNDISLIRLSHKVASKRIRTGCHIVTSCSEMLPSQILIVYEGSLH